jgi:two-component system sensor histidine kinase CiaH
MIKKLQRKFVAVAMLSLFIVLLIIIGTVNILNYTRMADDAQRTINILKENDGSFPKPDMKPGHGKEMFKGMSPEAPYESRYFSVLMDGSGNVSTIDTGKIAGTDTDEAAEYAAKVLECGRTSGFMGQYRFGIKDKDNGKLIIFLYCGRELSNFRAVLLISVGISFVGMLAVFLLLIFFSGRIVKPVSESYEKQKRFITDAGHEIKTPLTIIDADAELVGLDCGENEWLEDIRKQTKRLTALTNDLVYLAKMEEGQKSSTKIEFPLSDVVEETAESFRARAVNENKKLDIDIQPEITYCGDEKAIRQLVSILVDNAVKYSDGIKIISVKLEGQGGTSKLSKGFRLQVFNSCEHIEPESVKHLFDRFYRAEQSRNSQTGGYGIGLSVAKAVVDAHKGKITADTADGKSLRITVVM